MVSCRDSASKVQCTTLSLHFHVEEHGRDIDYYFVGGLFCSFVLFFCSQSVF